MRTDSSDVVLIAGDQAATQAVVQVLTPEACRLVCVESGAEALHKAIELLPNLILLHAALSDMDGVQACQRLRSSPFPATIPILMLAPLADHDLRALAVAAGADDLISTPLDPVELIARVRFALRLSRYRQLLAEPALRHQAEQTLVEQKRTLNERIKELGCLYTISDLVGRRDLPLDEILREIVDYIPPAWEYPELTAARICLGDQEFKSLNFEETDWAQREEIVAHGEAVGSIQVCYLQEQPPHENGPFLREERYLLKAISEQVGRMIERVRAEEELRRERDLAESILNTAQTIIVMFDPTGRIVYFNPYMETLSGYTLQEVQGKDWFTTFLRPCDQESVAVLFAQAMGDIQTRGNINPIVAKDGREVVVEWYDKTLKDEAGHVVGLLAVGQDVTERLRSEESLRQRNRELAAINRAGHAVGVSLDLDQVLVTLLEEMHDLTNGFSCAVWLLDTRTGELVCKQTSTPASRAMVGVRLPPGEGIAGWVVRSGESQLVDDVQADSRYRLPPSPGYEIPVRSQLCVPLWARRQVVGVLVAVDPEVSRFSPADLELLEPLAATAAIAIENAQLYEAVQEELDRRTLAEEMLRRRVAQLGLLNEFAAEVIALPDIESVFNSVAHMVQKTFGYHHVGLFLIDPEQGDLALRAAAESGLRKFPPDHRQRMDDGIIGWVARHGKTLTANDVSAEPRYATFYPGEQVTRSELAVPIKVEGEVAGVLDAQSPQIDGFDENDVLVMETLAHQLSGAIENAQLTQAAAEVEILQELNRLSAELVANVSHELRTPLGLIKVCATTLLREDVEVDRETTREFLQDINSETDRLTATVDSLLNLSQIETARLRLDVQPTDVGKIARKVIADARTWDLVPMPRFIASFGTHPLLALADAHRIEQVLRNLLNNSVKYSPEGGVVTVGMRKTKNQLHVWVKDEGIGIPAQDLERVFDRFYRVDNAVTRRVRGAGLGLPICKGIVEAHSGRIWIESAPGAGSTVHFTLPLAPPTEPQDDARQKEAA